MSEPVPDGMKSAVMVKAWDCCEEDGTLVLAVDMIMPYQEYLDRVAGRYAATSVRLLRAISRDEIDTALDKEFGKDVDDRQD